MKVLLNSAENDRGSFARNAIRPINAKPTSSPSPCFKRARSSRDNDGLPFPVPKCFAETHSWIRLKRDEGDWWGNDDEDKGTERFRRVWQISVKSKYRKRRASRWENVIFSQFHVPHTHTITSTFALVRTRRCESSLTSWSWFNYSWPVNDSNEPPFLTRVNVWHLQFLCTTFTNFRKLLDSFVYKCIRFWQ